MTTTNPGLGARLVNLTKRYGSATAVDDRNLDPESDSGFMTTTNPGLGARLVNVTKRYGSATAVNDLNLTVESGEFLSILGPSGCGKTTTLRMLAGFAVPEEGEIFLNGQSVTNMPPYKRDVNTVFQSYALFGHLSVADNVAFGLKRRRVAKAEITRRVGEMLELVKLAGRGNAKPDELSGGQQQRVALARALVNMPSVLLLDEPLGALDLKLRREMQIELKRIHREIGVTFVFVTHDQEEALTMSDRVAVMDGGVLQQIGRPTEVYDSPVNGFVAGFIGTSNLLAGEISGGELALDGGDMKVALGPGVGQFGSGDRVTLSIRPERVRVASELDGGLVSFPGEVSDVIFLGSTTHVAVTLPGDRSLVAVQTHAEGESVRRGDSVQVGWRPDDAVLLGH
jgi:spermidine/putrescine transport system ATP-binding protein